MQLMLYPVWAVAYLGFHFRGVQNIFGKVGVFAWREAPCSAWLKMVRFGEYFAKIL